MKLLLPKVLDHIENKTIVICGYASGERIIGKNDPLRVLLRTNVVPTIKAAQKFVFDSGADRDKDTIDAVRDTALSMMQAGLFHLPFPTVWMEDPFDADDAHALVREKGLGFGEFVPESNFYLCEEREHSIDIRMFQAVRQPGIPWLIAYEDVATIDLAAPRHESFMNGRLMHLVERESHEVGSLAQALEAKKRLHAKVKSGEGVYALKKLLVTLATAQAVREHVKANPKRAGLPAKWRDYDHTIVRVPLDTSYNHATDPSSSRVGGKRRKHLVRGYMWGKNTRPAEQQRWIAPFYRGDAEAVGTIEHDHYEVRAPRFKGLVTD